MKRWPLLLLLVLSVPFAVARDPTPSNSGGIPTAVIGTGQISCGKFIEYRRADNKAQLDLIVQWVWGYLSAYNLRWGWQTNNAGMDAVSPPDSATVLLFIEHYCEKYPLDEVVNGTLTLLKSLGGTQFPKVLPHHPD